MVNLCGVPTCCSCDTSSSSDGCKYKVCTAETSDGGIAQCVEVYRSDLSQETLRMSTVQCQQTFEISVEDSCSSLLEQSGSIRDFVRILK